MSTVSSTSTPQAAAPSVASPSVRHRATGKQTFARAVRAEWIKLVTLRSTWISSFLTLLLTTGTGVAIAVGYANEGGDPTAWQTLPSGTMFGEIVVAVLGALIITSEYSSGQIRSSLGAVPRRSRVLGAKALVIAVWAFLLGVVSIILAWAIATPLMNSGTISLTDHRLLGYAWGTGLGYAGIALMSLGLGFLLRSTASSISLVVVILFVIQIPLNLASMKWEWAVKALEIIPSSSINSVIDPYSTQFQWAGTGDSQMWLTHTGAVTAFACWVLIPVLAGWVAFTRRDA